MHGAPSRVRHRLKDFKLKGQTLRDILNYKPQSEENVLSESELNVYIYSTHPCASRSVIDFIWMEYIYKTWYFNLTIGLGKRVEEALMIVIQTHCGNWVLGGIVCSSTTGWISVTPWIRISLVASENVKNIQQTLKSNVYNWLKNIKWQRSMRHCLSAKIQTGQRQSLTTDNLNDKFYCFSCQLDLFELFTRQRKESTIHAITQQFLNNIDNTQHTLGLDLVRRMTLQAFQACRKLWHRKIMKPFKLQSVLCRYRSSVKNF